MKNHNLLTEGNVFHVLLAFSVPFPDCQYHTGPLWSRGSYGHRVVLYA